MLPDKVTSDNVIETTEQQNLEIKRLQLEAKNRTKAIRFIISSFGSMTLFVFLTVITGIRYEYTKDTGAKYSYQFPLELLSVPSIVSLIVAGLGLTYKTTDKQK